MKILYFPLRFLYEIFVWDFCLHYIFVWGFCLRFLFGIFIWNFLEKWDYVFSMFTCNLFVIFVAKSQIYICFCLYDACIFWPPECMHDAYTHDAEFHGGTKGWTDGQCDCRSRIVLVICPIFVQPLICCRSVKYLSLSSLCICTLRHFSCASRCICEIQPF